VQEFVDQGERALGVVRPFDPELRQGGLDRNLAQDARGVRIEDARANAPIRKMAREEVGLGQVRSGVDPLQNLYDTMAVTPSSLIPWRLLTA
jgi:hypothetical protein